MRRRIKFVMSVASLTLAMFMAMFGVWAAATRQVAITGSLSFTSESVAATITVYEFYGDTINTSTAKSTTTFTAAGTQTGADVSLAPALNDSQVKYSFIIKIEGKFPSGASSKINIAVVAPTVPSAASGWLDLKQSSGTSAPTALPTATTPVGNTSIAGNGVHYYTFTYTATPANAPASATALGFNCSVTLSRANA